MEFGNAESRDEFAEDLRNAITDWVTKYGRFVKIPNNYNPYCQGMSKTISTGCKL